MPKNPTLTRLAAIIGMTVVIFLLDWFYLTYITSKGFALKVYEIVLGTVKVSIPLQWLPVLGVLLVTFVLWYEVSFAIFPRRVVSEQETLSSLRLMRVIVFSVAGFACVLYVPYIIGSDWFWTRMSAASSISQVHDFAQSLLNADQALMALDQIWQYSISQFVALIAMSFCAWIFGRTSKRIRR